MSETVSPALPAPGHRATTVSRVEAPGMDPSPHGSSGGAGAPGVSHSSHNRRDGGAGSAPNHRPATGFGFTPGRTIPGQLGRTGVITTPHGDITTPAFIVVGTQASVKAVLPRDVAGAGAQAVLANAYHLYLQPGADLVDEAGGVGAFMGWAGPTFTDSGGFQVLSQGAGFKKILAMDTKGLESDDVIAPGKERLALVDDDGVNFRSFRDGSKHRFTPEVSMRIQHQLGADIMFAFDECTTLMNTRAYQERSLERTYAWALRCLAEHRRQTETRAGKPYQALFGVVQGAQYEDLRRRAARELAAAEADGQVFDGFGIGGALEKANLGTICRWINEELPVDKPRHLLGISEPEDLFAGIAAGADTFDCVNPSRTARNGRVYTDDGCFNVDTLPNKRSFAPLEDGCDCDTCAHHTRAYLHHLARSKELLFYTLMTIHNERFHLRLVDRIRQAIEAGDFEAFRVEFLGRYQARRRTRMS